MSNENRPKVLVFTVDPWCSKGGTYTFSELLDGYGAERVANIYIRDGIPDSSAADKFFCVSEKRMLKRYFNKKIKTGFEVNRVEANGAAETDDNGFYGKVYSGSVRKRSYLLLTARELMWKFGNWKTKELNDFLSDFSPDVIIFPMEGYIHFIRLAIYAVKKTGAAAIGYFWDDNFTFRQGRNLGHCFLRVFQRRAIKKAVKVTDRFFAITDKTKKEADAAFGIDCKLLTKPILSSHGFVDTSVNSTIRILYTGKLIGGRENSIRLLCGAVKRIGESGISLRFDIYSQNDLSYDFLKDNKYCIYHGSVSREVVLREQQNADILVFAEAVDSKTLKTARLSFSTKLTDYFSAGKCIFAIGSEDLAPIDYLKAHNAAVAATSEKEIYDNLLSLVSSPKKITEYAKQSYLCGVENHDSKKIKKVLFDEIKECQR